MKLLVVDDEPLARRRLLRLCAQIPDVVVVGEAGDGVEAAERIAALDPDVVLLDIQMPGADGLTLAAQLAARAGERPVVVFTTAHAQHALAAFDAAAVDYLLKPVPLERLRRALDHARRRLGDALAGADVPRVSARDRDTVHVVDARSVERFYAADKYTGFRIAGRELLSDESLNALEARLAAHGFVRVHRGELVRLDAVRALRPAGDGDGAIATLASGDEARVSRRLVTELKRKLGLA
jgi:two-component system, LytTR family, response regulator